MDSDLFCPKDTDDGILDLKQELGIPFGSQVVVYLGLLAEYQGISLLLEAARELAHRYSDLHFLVMGHPNVEQYRALAARLGIGEQVTFTRRIRYLEATATCTAGIWPSPLSYPPPRAAAS